MHKKTLIDYGKPFQSKMIREKHLHFFDHLHHRLRKEFVEFYRSFNGLYAFESALLVRPLASVDKLHGLMRWNHRELWKYCYQGNDIFKKICFAEDLFGGQFCAYDSIIEYFDPESGGFEFISDSFEQWQSVLLSDYNYYTGFSLSHEWQLFNKPLDQGSRLCPKKFFILQGEYCIDNLYEINDVRGMRIRGEFYQQTKQLNNGDNVIINII